MKIIINIFEYGSVFFVATWLVYNGHELDTTFFIVVMAMAVTNSTGYFRGRLK